MPFSSPGPLVLRGNSARNLTAFGWGVLISCTAISTAFSTTHFPGGFVSGVS